MGVLGIVGGWGGWGVGVEGKGVQGCQISRGAKSLGGPKPRHLVFGLLNGSPFRKRSTAFGVDA